MMPATGDCTIPINTDLPLKEPYRTGSYLIYDYPLGADPHFREGLEKIGLRASGSRQLNFEQLADVLKSVAGKVKTGGKLDLVDLRQESHLFFNRRAVSWYADKDWANVGQPQEWILNDEISQIERLSAWPISSTVQIFCLDEKSKEEEHVIPTGYSKLTVTSADTEAGIAGQIQLPCPVTYVRIPVTDHCMPNRYAQDRFVTLCRYLYRQPYDQTWVHYHCHGGDGRTTTFLAMYDMVCWAKTNGLPLPAVKVFADRQLEIFTYNLDPGNCDEATNWKCYLARVRWAWLGTWRDWINTAGLSGEEPLELNEIGAIS